MSKYFKVPEKNFIVADCVIDNSACHIRRHTDSIIEHTFIAVNQYFSWKLADTHNRLACNNLVQSAWFQLLGDKYSDQVTLPKVPGIPKSSAQSSLRYPDALAQLGCRVSTRETWHEPPNKLRTTPRDRAFLRHVTPADKWAGTGGAIAAGSTGLGRKQGVGGTGQSWSSVAVTNWGGLRACAIGSFSQDFGLHAALCEGPGDTTRHLRCSAPVRARLFLNQVYEGKRNVEIK